jgi:hypothetical protein
LVASDDGGAHQKCKRPDGGVNCGNSRNLFHTCNISGSVGYHVARIDCLGSSHNKMDDTGWPTAIWFAASASAQTIAMIGEIQCRADGTRE